MRNTARPKDGATPKRVTVKPRWWEDEPPFEVDLIENRFSESLWEVHDPQADGSWIGTVGRYHGSLDQKIAGTRQRRAGNRRVLWSAKSPTDDRTEHELVSRADAIRRLRREAGS